ncbi:MAG: FHA domain-containing protein [Phycisphaerales bacterium]|nr:FHA domain-containing protein [Phycisphaerales bacterium]MCB9864305.1 FHA domain-containing protein [Phycisphaerales bacterium]
MPSLTILNGAQCGAQFLLARRILGIGRNPARDVQLRDPKVSRKHALVRYMDGAYLLVPANALNGVIINGVRIESAHRLCDGDVITLGDTHLHFEGYANRNQIDALQQRKQTADDVRNKSTLLMTQTAMDGAAHGS